MRAIICPEPGRLEAVEIEAPVAGPGMVSVDIREVGICGTDFHIYKGLHPFLEYPRIMGHELSGVVVDGAESDALKPGTSVVINPYLSCGDCIACRKGKPNCCANLRVLGVHMDGGMCERIMVPEQNLYPADGLSLRDAAMVEFQAIGAHAVSRSELVKGDRVLVVGGGPIGIGTAFFAKLAGGDVTVMDMSLHRLSELASMGLKSTILADDRALEEADKLTGGERFDVVFDATGNAAAMERSFDFVASGGTIVMVGVLKATISFDDPEFHRRELTIRATRNATKADFETVMSAMKAGHIPLDRINTHNDRLDALPKAMPEWLAGEARPIKAMVSV